MKRFGRRKFFRRRGRKGKKSSFAKRVLKVVKKVQELKYYDTVTTSSIDFSGSVYSISDVPQGDMDLSRDGDKLMPTSLDIRMGFRTADTYNVFRYIIFRWLPDNTPTVSDILTSSLLATSNAPYSHLFHDARSKFNVILDRMVSGTLSSSSDLRIYHMTKKLAKKSINYNAGTTVGSGKLYALVISDSGAATHPTVFANIRLNYTDS